MCCIMCTEYRYSSAMSCTGQSDAPHKTSIAPAKQTRFMRLTTCWPAGTAFGPITRTQYTYAPTRKATSSQTSGCHWNARGLNPRSVIWCGAGCAIAPELWTEEVERQQRGAVHADRQEQPRVEQHPEQAVVELEVHEVEDDGEELDRHHDQEQRQEQLAEVVLGVAERHLQAGDDRQGERQLDVLEIA